MKKLIIIAILTCTLFSSCVDFISIVDGKIYYDFDAIISYEIYNELYKNDSVNFSKPVLLKLNKNTGDIKE